MAIEEKKRKHKDGSEKSSKKKQKSITKIIAPGSPATSVTVTTPTAATSFSEVVVKLYLHLAPMWSGKTTEGVNEQLNAFLMKYGKFHFLLREYIYFNISLSIDTFPKLTVLFSHIQTLSLIQIKAKSFMIHLFVISLLL